MINIRSFNPDVLSCLANLSNDEVFTPPKLANEILDMLPPSLWSGKNAKSLDPCSKTGVFLREIAKRLFGGLIDLFGNLVGFKPSVCLTSLAFFRAKALQKCDFYMEVVQKLKFPNNSDKFPLEDWQFISRNGMSYEQCNKKKPFVCFGSLSGLLTNRARSRPYAYIHTMHGHNQAIFFLKVITNP